MFDQPIKEGVGVLCPEDLHWPLTALAQIDAGLSRFVFEQGLSYFLIGVALQTIISKSGLLRRLTPSAAMAAWWPFTLTMHAPKTSDHIPKIATKAPLENQQTSLLAHVQVLPKSVPKRFILIMHSLIDFANCGDLFLQFSVGGVLCLEQAVQ